MAKLHKNINLLEILTYSNNKKFKYCGVWQTAPKINLPKFLVYKQIEMLLMHGKIVNWHKILTGDVKEVLWIYGKTAQKVNLPTSLIRKLQKNMKVLLIIGKLPKNVICLNVRQ